MNEETYHGIDGEDGVVSGTSEFAPTRSQLLSGVRSVSERIDSMIADVVRSREALHWSQIRQVVDNMMNNPRDITAVVQVVRAARDLQGIFQLHQIVINTMIESNGILRSLLQDALQWNDSELSQTTSQLLSGLRQVSEGIDSMIADAARSRDALHWAGLSQLLEDVKNTPRDVEYVTKLACAARDLQGIIQLHQNVLDRAAESNQLLHSLLLPEQGQP